MSEGDKSEEATGWAVAADLSVWPGDKTRIGFPSNSSKFRLNKAAYRVFVLVCWWTMLVII